MKKEIITPDTVAKPAAPYAAVIKVTAPGSLVFVSGVVSSDIDGNILHKGDILAQAKQTVKNLISFLEGNDGEVIRTWEREMQAMAAELRFEESAPTAASMRRSTSSPGSASAGSTAPATCR